MDTIVIDFRPTGPLTFKDDLGVFPMHLGCCAGSSHPNCGKCFPELYTIPFKGAR